MLPLFKIASINEKKTAAFNLIPPFKITPSQASQSNIVFHQHAGSMLEDNYPTCDVHIFSLHSSTPVFHRTLSTIAMVMSSSSSQDVLLHAFAHTHLAEQLFNVVANFTLNLTKTQPTKHQGGFSFLPGLQNRFFFRRSTSRKHLVGDFG